jgi:tRNA pseudouridine65 synthase
MGEKLDILYLDQHLVAINKPAGLLVHRSPIDRHETRFALQLLRDQLGQRVYPIHRLDKPTSGVLLFGRSSDAARRVALEFGGRRVQKTYLAVLRGHCEPEGSIDYPLREEPDQRPAGTEGEVIRAARTDYRRLASVELPFAVGRYPSSRYCLVEARPITGRRRQLRRHFKHIFHPIAGDTTYGDGRHNRFFRQQFGCARLLLAATELTLAHPYSGCPLTIQAPLSADFAMVLDAFDWRDALPPAWWPQTTGTAP